MQDRTRTKVSHFRGRFDRWDKNTMQASENKEAVMEVVPGGGIEPPTRGFSTKSSTNKISQLVETGMVYPRFVLR